MPAGNPDTAAVVARLPLSSRLCDRIVVVFAVWTVCCHAVVLAGGSLLTLLIVAAVVALGAGGLIAARRWGRIRRPAVARESAPTTPTEPAGDSDPRFRLRGAGLLLGLGAIGVYALRGDLLLHWWWIVLVLIAAALATAGEQPRLVSPPAPLERRNERILWGVGLACVAIALIAHRPDADDAFYINLAVAAADSPRSQLLRWDTLHGIEGLPIHLPVYRVHSYEILNGALAYLSGIPAIHCFHLISAALAALLLPLAQARLLRILVPRRWLYALLVLLVILIAIGAPHRWYGNFGLVRIWQGKAIFVSVLLPLLYAYGLELAGGPSRRRWLQLAAAQIAAVGFTSSALWAGPLAAGSALLAGSAWRREALPRLLLGAIPSLYVLALAVSIRASMSPVPWAYGARLLEQRGATPGRQLLGAVLPVLGSRPLLIVGTAALVLGWVSCRRPLARRFALVVPLPAWLLINPYTDHLVRDHLIGGSLWRALWALPIPLLLTLIVIAPLGLDARPLMRWGGRAVSLVLILVLAIAVPPYSVLSPRNRGVRIDWPGLKVPEDEARAASALAASVHGRPVVAAPDSVATWITTRHHHPFPLKVRHYLRRQRSYLGKENVAAREWVASELGKPMPDAAQLIESLQGFGVQGVCTVEPDPDSELPTALLGAGYRHRASVPGYEIWTRP